MNVLFVMQPRADRGNTHALANYIQVGEDLGHTMALFGMPQPNMPGVRFSTDVGAFDRVVYLFESELYRARHLQEVALLGTFPRRHRFILDSDGMYNPRLQIDGYDRNHRDDAEQEKWRRFCDDLADQVFQPTLRLPIEPRAAPLPFYGYNQSLAVDPESTPEKRYDVLYVGHNWWRWRDMSEEILPSLEQIRDQLGEVGFIGLWWDGTPEWASALGLEPAYRGDWEAFGRLRISTSPPVAYADVIRTMSTSRINLFMQRPLLRHLSHLTLKYFEIFCADTIPLLMIEPDLAEAVYGPAGRELTLPGRVAEKVLDALQRPELYMSIVEEVRRHLFTHHSYRRRVEELVTALAD